MSNEARDILKLERALRDGVEPSTTWGMAFMGYGLVMRAYLAEHGIQLAIRGFTRSGRHLEVSPAWREAEELLEKAAELEERAELEKRAAPRLSRPAVTDKLKEFFGG